ncbi:MAG: hypothetical protein HY907_21770 [Deltaproteobacteria bacterium]|nr:hypothetical protein [Deltaproteobacteria bacterium]
MRLSRFVIPVLVLVATPATARAADWRLGMEALTDLPLQAGGRWWVEAPYGLHLDTSLGSLPPGYVDLINSVVVEFEGYGEDTATLISAVVSSSLVWRIHLGWRPSADWGFYFTAGYGMVAMNGEVAAGKLILAVLGQKIAEGVPDANGSYRASSTLHMVDAEIGYMWSMIEDHLTVRLALGFAGTVASATTVEPRFQPAQPAAVAEWTRRSAQYLDDIYTKYLFLPLISVGVGYRYF